MSFLPRHPLHTLVQSKLFMATGTKQLMLSSFAGSTAAVLLPRRLLHLPSHAHFINKNRLVLLSGTLRSRPRSTGLRCVAPIMTRSTVHMEPEVSKKLEQLKKQLEGQGIYYNAIPGQHTHLMCPKCGGGQSKEKSLALNIREDGEQAMWSCFRGKCGWRGHFQLSGQSNTNRSTKTEKYSTFTEESLQLEQLCLELVEYFSARKISSETLRRNAVMQRISFEKEVVIAFTYKREGTLVNCKYRDRNKKFWQEKDAEKILYGLDDIKRAEDIIIVEGEMDKLSMEEAGFMNCVSVPDGAPAKVSTKLPDEEEDSKFEYLWNCKSYFEKASRIIIATDADSPGQALAEELARRLGKERCWRVEWPKNNDGSVCKDANEVLMYLGPDALREVINNAEIYPIRGLFKFSDFFQEIDSYYKHSFGDELGFSTGWKSVDNFYKVVPGELTVVTGVPNSGKSEWIDAIICNINRSQGWKFALCSMENKVREHARKLLEKHVRKPFFNASYSNSVERMSIEEFEQGKQWLNDTYYLIRCEDDSLPSIQWVLSLAKAAVLRYGVRGLVIDPYNELDHQRHLNQTETEYVSQILTKIKRFAQHHSCHVWFVAHPKQLQNWGGGAPNMYDISGSAHFINKCDNGIVVHRNRNKDAGPLDRVQICVRKVRNKVVGSVGDAFLSYNRVTGEYEDIDGPSKTF